MHLFAPNEDCLVRACEDIGTTVEQLHRDVRDIKGWMAQQPHLPVIRDSLLVENMLLRCRGEVKATLKALDFHLSMRAAAPEFFADRDPLSEELQLIARNWTNVVLSQLTSEGYRVKLFVLAPKDSLEQFSNADALKFWLMMDDMRLKEDISLGEVIISDMRALSMGHLRRLTPAFMKNAYQFGLNGYKPRMKGIHLLHAPPLVGKLLWLLKLILPRKMAARIHVHPDLESLHKFVEPKILPKEYGGDQKPLLEMASDWQRKIESFRDWFMGQEASREVDESEEHTISLDHSCEFLAVEESLKNLEFD